MADDEESYFGRLFEARDKLIRSVLTVIAGDYAMDTDDPHFADQAELDEEQMGLAAQDYVTAIDSMPPTDRPVGWDPPPVSHLSVVREKVDE